MPHMPLRSFVQSKILRSWESISILPTTDCVCQDHLALVNDVLELLRILDCCALDDVRFHHAGRDGLLRQLYGKAKGVLAAGGTGGHGCLNRSKVDNHSEPHTPEHQGAACLGVLLRAEALVVRIAGAHERHLCHHCKLGGVRGAGEDIDQPVTNLVALVCLKQLAAGCQGVLEDFEIFLGDDLGHCA
eukprot:scaffold173985_cov44-Prasinocladus_malaysianus.AAC.1